MTAAAKAQTPLQDVTPDEEAYLRKIQTSAERYDPTAVVGGPSESGEVERAALVIRQHEKCGMWRDGKCIDVVEYERECECSQYASKILKAALASAPAPQAGVTREQDLVLTFQIEPREGGYRFLTCRDLPGFSLILEPGEAAAATLQAPLVAFLEAEFRVASHAGVSGPGEGRFTTKRPVAFLVATPEGPFHFSHETDANQFAKECDCEVQGLYVRDGTSLNFGPAQGGVAVGWIVANENEDRFRMWSDVGPDWTTDRDKALRFARRRDAEAFCADDEDAWKILPHGKPCTDAAAQIVSNIVGEAMEDAWNDICSDTQNHPLDIEQNFEGQKGHLGFSRNHWARITGDRVADALLSAAPSPSPQRQENDDAKETD